MRRPSILIVDDSPFILQLLETVFGEEGFEVRGALDGRAALREAEKTTPDVVLLDVRMPEMDGWEVLQALRRAPPLSDVPVAVMSTDEAQLGWTLAVGRGAQAYVAKPFSPGDLVRGVRELLREADFPGDRTDPSAPSESSAI